MKTKRKTNVIYVLLVLLSLLLGLGIQQLLSRSQTRRETAVSRELLAEQSAAAREAAEQELARRESVRRQAVPGITRLAELRRAYQSQGNEDLLILVNRSHPLPEDYEPELELVEEKDGRSYYLDVRCAQAFWNMMAECAADGGQPYICSGYRSREDQEKLVEDKVRRLTEEGVSPEEAPEQALMTVAEPGTSEHELGLAADLFDESYPYLDELQEQTPTQLWLMENSWRYGFILRYPNGTTEQTGILYEPWHYRYVGRAYAEEIHMLGLTLEEYLVRREGR